MYQDQEAPLGSKGLQYVLKTFFVILALKNNVNVSDLVSPSYVISILVPIKGWARWPRWTRTKRRERIWSKLMSFKAIWNLLLPEKAEAHKVAGHCNLNDHLPFQSKDHWWVLNRAFVSNCIETWLLVNYVFWLPSKFPFASSLVWLCENCLILFQSNCLLDFSKKIPQAVKPLIQCETYQSHLLSCSEAGAEIDCMTQTHDWFKIFLSKRQSNCLLSGKEKICWLTEFSHLFLRALVVVAWTAGFVICTVSSLLPCFHSILILTQILRKCTLL